MKRRTFIAASAGLAGLIAAPAFVRAQSAWPSRQPIKLVAQFPAGGLVDVVSRLMAPILSQALGQTVVVENRPGAGGVIGTDYVAKQPADGYTLLVSHAAVHVYAAATRRTMPFDAVADFTHMGMLVEAPMVLVVRGASPYQTLEQYVTAARTKAVRYGTSGIGSANHLFGELLKTEGKAPLHDHVPYQGSAPAMQDLNGGHIDSVFDSITTKVATLKAGSLRALAVSTPKRLPALNSGDSRYSPAQACQAMFCAVNGWIQPLHMASTMLPPWRRNMRLTTPSSTIGVARALRVDAGYRSLRSSSSSSNSGCPLACAISRPSSSRTRTFKPARVKSPTSALRRHSGMATGRWGLATGNLPSFRLRANGLRSPMSPMAVSTSTITARCVNQVNDFSAISAENPAVAPTCRIRSWPLTRPTIQLMPNPCASGACVRRSRDASGVSIRAKCAWA